MMPIREKKDYWDQEYLIVECYPLRRSYYALGVDSIPYKDGIYGVPEWTEKLQKLAWDTAKMPAQVYLVSKKPKTLFGDVDNVFTALLLSGPDYHSSKEDREAVAKALGFRPEDIAKVYPAFLPE